MTEELIERTSLRVSGWLVANVHDWHDVETGAFDTSSCRSFSDPRDTEGVNGQNAQIAKLIVAVGDNDSAVAKRQGFASDQELDDLADGSSGQKLCVPAHLRSALIEIGLQGALVPINLFAVREKDPVFLAGDAWTDLEFEVAIDSGAVVHVCSPQDCPGYVLEESAGSRRGQEFLMGDGGTIPNLG